MIAAQADFAALVVRLAARARALAQADRRLHRWRDARRLWPLFTRKG